MTTALRSAFSPLIAVAMVAAVTLAPRDVAAEPLLFKIDPAASEVTVAVAEPLASVRGDAAGRMKVLDGEVRGDPADPANTGRVQIVIDARSYTSGNAWRDSTVKSGALDVDTHPTITFASESLENVVLTGNAAGSAMLIGRLTLHGRRREIRVPVRASLGGDGRLLAEGEAEFDYTEFGMAAPTLGFGALKAGDRAKVKFRIVAIKAMAGR
jgi:polyisoprenoid-binding protein YceI